MPSTKNIFDSVNIASKEQIRRNIRHALSFNKSNTPIHIDLNTPLFEPSQDILMEFVSKSNFAKANLSLLKLSISFQDILRQYTPHLSFSNDYCCMIDTISTFFLNSPVKLSILSLLEI